MLWCQIVQNGYEDEKSLGVSASCRMTISNKKLQLENVVGYSEINIHVEKAFLREIIATYSFTYLYVLLSSGCHKQTPLNSSYITILLKYAVWHFG